jgi:peroxiredoxin Q/BCP
MKQQLLIVSFLLGAGFFIKRASSEEVPAAGQKAPDFTLPSQDGSAVSLKDFRGKWVVLYFYPKDNTPGCTIEAHNFQRDLSKFEQDHAVILGVSVDSADSHKNFCARQGLTFKLLADTEKKVAAQYGSLKSIVGFKIADRNTFLIDPKGKIVKVWTGVSPARHSEEVLSALAGLGAGKG